MDQDSRINAAGVIAIYRDPLPTGAIARKWGLTRSQVARIKGGTGPYAHVVQDYNQKLLRYYRSLQWGDYNEKIFKKTG